MTVPHNKQCGTVVLRDMFKRGAILVLIVLATLTATAQGLVAKGVAAETKGLSELAEGYYRQASDTSAEARLRLGVLLEGEERYDEAIRWLAAADSGAEAMAHLAACFAERRRWDEARSAAEKALELASDSENGLQASAMGTLALVYCEQGNYTNAAIWVRKALAADPMAARPHNIDGIVRYRRGDDNEAIKTFREALKLEPDNIDACFNLGSLYCYRNNHDLAISTLRQGLKKHRKSVKLLYALGWAYKLKGETAGAIECLQNVVSIDSDYVNAYNRMGDIYFERGEFDNAVEQYRHAIRIAPGLSEAYRLIGRTYAEQRLYPKAIHYYQKAVGIDGSDAETYCAIAELYGRQGQQAKEKANYRRAARLGHQNARQWCTQHSVTY